MQGELIFSHEINEFSPYILVLIAAEFPGTPHLQLIYFDWFTLAELALAGTRYFGYDIDYKLVEQRYG